MLVIVIILTFVGISIILFTVFFRYTIIIAKQETIKKSRESLMVLALVNKKYSFGENFVLSLSNDTDATSKEIYDFIFNFYEFNDTISLPFDYTKTAFLGQSIYYYFDFGKPTQIEYISNGKCYEKPLKCGQYTYVMKFPIPILFDGTNFIKEGVYISFV
ncbi:MAG: hypothetical protein QXJ06_00435 [Candidatus Aenigmatarchaeota archaeon]